MDGGDRADGEIGPAPVCVTGSTGYIGSWLVRSLLQKGYTVHATARDPGKAKLFLPWWGGDDSRLKIFQADLNESGSFDKAVRGCVGVFHVAASMDFHVSSVVSDIDSHVRANVLEPAVRGMLNLLESCRRAGSVRRLVITSSISIITAKDEDGKFIQVVNESCATPAQLIWKTKPSGWVYVLSKLMTEKAAFDYAKENGIDLVSIIPTTVAGPFLTPKVPASVQVLLSPITGDTDLYPILLAVHERLGSISVVHIDDICRAHIFLFEQESASGRYICSAGSCLISQLAHSLAREFPFFNPRRFFGNVHDLIPSCISSKKLEDLGFEFKHGVEEIIRESVASSVQGGYLKAGELYT